MKRAKKNCSAMPQSTVRQGKSRRLFESTQASEEEHHDAQQADEAEHAAEG